MPQMGGKWARTGHNVCTCIQSTYPENNNNNTANWWSSLDVDIWKKTWSETLNMLRIGFSVPRMFYFVFRARHKWRRKNNSKTHFIEKRWRKVLSQKIMYQICFYVKTFVKPLKKNEVSRIHIGLQPTRTCLTIIELIKRNK